MITNNNELKPIYKSTDKKELIKRYNKTNKKPNKSFKEVLKSTLNKQ